MTFNPDPENEGTRRHLRVTEAGDREASDR